MMLFVSVQSVQVYAWPMLPVLALYSQLTVVIASAAWLTQQQNTVPWLTS